jgi:hypothetical protein
VSLLYIGSVYREAFSDSCYLDSLIYLLIYRSVLGVLDVEFGDDMLGSLDRARVREFPVFLLLVYSLTKER